MTLPVGPSLNQQRALDHITAHPGASTREVARAMGVPTGSAGVLLSGLYVKRLVGRQEAMWAQGMQWHWFPETAPSPVANRTGPAADAGGRV